MVRNRNLSKVRFRLSDVKTKHVLIVAIGIFVLALFYAFIKPKSGVDLNQNYNHEHLHAPIVNNEESYFFGYDLKANDQNHGTIYASLDVPLRSILPGSKNIFFLETSCVFTERKVGLTARQACAIESVAKMNPDHKIYFMHSCKIDAEHLKQAGAYLRQLFRYENVKFSRLNATAMSEGTLLEEWWRSGPLKHSELPAAHASDILKYLVLSRFGGTVMDLDFVAVRPLPGWHNFLGSESDWVVSNTVMGLDPGHDLAYQFLQEVKDTYRGDSWGWNGPELVTRVMQRVCNVTEVTAMTPAACGGITVLRPEVFSPLHWLRSQTLFKVNEESSAFLHALVSAESSTVAVRAWNVINEGIPVHVGSRQPYGVIAHQCCPRVYSNCGLVF